MYHGITPDYHLIILVFAILAWIGRGLYKGFQQISRQMQGSGRTIAKPNPIQQAIAEARQQTTMPPSGATQSAPKAIQVLPSRSPPLGRVREMPRRPEAGGPAVPREATDEELRRQEQDLFSAEPTALAAPLRDKAAFSAAGTPRALFGNTDDLIRAVILQEVLGPPLSRRSSHQTTPRPQPPG